MKKAISRSGLLLLVFVCTAMAPKAYGQTDTFVGAKCPVISGESLAGIKVDLPQAAAGKVTLVMVAFKRDSIPLLDPWLEAYDDAFGKKDGYAFYKIPMMKSSFAKQISGMINEKMKKDNPKELHDNIVTYYGPVDAYLKAMGISDEEKGYAFIIDQKGVVQWKSSGSADQESIREMISAAARLGE